MKALILSLALLLQTNSLWSSNRQIDHLPQSHFKDQLQTQKIEKMIKKVNPIVKAHKRKKVAKIIQQVTKTYKIDPKVMIAIIDTESEFIQHKISSSGDLSIAQINLKVWNKELKRLNLETINEKKLIKDEKYALVQMGRILSILKDRHAETDKKWYATYHSKTKKFKNIYSKKVDLRIRKIASL